MTDKQNPFLSKTVGNADKGSRAKANSAMAQAEKTRETLDSESWPRGASGTPMMKVVMTAAELIPTGQYANVSVGPAQITAFVDPDRTLDEGQAYFTAQERAVMAQALNELAEVVEADVVAVQRNLVMESMQTQVTND